MLAEQYFKRKSCNKTTVWFCFMRFNDTIELTQILGYLSVCCGMKTCQVKEATQKPLMVNRRFANNAVGEKKIMKKYNTAVVQRFWVQAKKCTSRKTAHSQSSNYARGSEKSFSLRQQRVKNQSVPSLWKVRLSSCHPQINRGEWLEQNFTKNPICSNLRG